MKSDYFVYLLMNQRNTVIYTGMTNDLSRRMDEHKSHLIKGFTKRYNVDKLVYFEIFEDVYEAINREKEIKKWGRRKKLILIKSTNPKLKDLSDSLGLYLNY